MLMNCKLNISLSDFYQLCVSISGRIIVALKKGMKMFINICVIILSSIYLVKYSWMTKKQNKKMFYLVFAIYLFSVLNITLFCRQPMNENKMVLQIFYSYFEIYQQEWEHASKYILITTMGNVIAFMPLGMGLKILQKEYLTTMKIVLVGFVFSLLIEVIQWTTCLGTFEIDDLLHNTLGCLFGVQIYDIVISLKKRNKYEIILRKVVPILGYGLFVIVICIKPWLEYISR